GEQRAQLLVRLAVDATGARRAALWRRAETGLELAGSVGGARSTSLVERALSGRDPALVDPGPEGTSVVALQLGRPPFAALDVERIGIYLRDGDRLVPAAGRSLAGPHTEVAERLLELVLGPFRARGMLAVTRAPEDRRLGQARAAAAEAGIEAVHAVPLVALG